MVSSLSMIVMGITCFICFVIPLMLIWWARKKYQASLKSFFIGMIAFIVAVQILEAPFHLYFLKHNLTTASWLGQPILYGVYAGLMAGIFEESARYICFKWILKKENRLQDAFSYGIGHGGIEAMLIVGTTYLSNLVVSIFINQGLLDSLGFSSDLQEVVTQQLTMTPSILFGVAGYERLMTIIIQIGLSILVFKAVREKKIRYYVIAILLHALLDFPAAFYQLGLSNLWVMEGIVTLFAIGWLVFIIKQMKKYRADLTRCEDEELLKYQKAGY